MNLKLLFEQLSEIRKAVKIPLILMGYINPVVQYGIEAFCKKCSETGIDGVILPDLPLDEYEEHYKIFFEKYNLHNILLITPQTSEGRIRQIDAASTGFIYMVSSSSTTGAGKKVEDFKQDYFERIQQMNLKNPRLIGFGISDNATFANACKYASGAIIGSAFVKSLGTNNNLTEWYFIICSRKSLPDKNQKKKIYVLKHLSYYKINNNHVNQQFTSAI